MWLVFNNKLNDEPNLLIIGKSLLLSQKFEDTCKNFVLMMSLTKKVAIEKEFELESEEHGKYIDLLLSLFLGQSINYYKNYLKEIVKNSDIEILKKAKYARNYICHESTVDFLYSSIYSKKDYKWNMNLLEKYIKDIAEGDYYVSRWTYEFQEKESGSFYNKKAYINNIIEWIFNKKLNKT